MTAIITEVTCNFTLQNLVAGSCREDDLAYLCDLDAEKWWLCPLEIFKTYHTKISD